MKLDKRLLRLAQSSATVQLILAISLGLLAGIMLVGQALFLSRTIAGVFLFGESLPAVAMFLAGFVLVALVRAVSSWGSETAAGQVAGRVKLDLRSRLMARLLALGPAYSQGQRTGELTSTLVEGVEALDAYFSQYLPQLALAALVPLAILAVILPLDPLSGLVLLLTAPLLPLFMVLIGNLADGLTQRQWTTLSHMSAHFLDVLQGLTTLKIFGRARAQIRAIRSISDQFGDMTMRVLRVAFLSALVMELVATLGVAIVAVEIGLRLLSGRIPFEQALFILILAPEFYMPLRLLGQRFHAGMTGVEAAERIWQLLGEDAGETKGLQATAAAPISAVARSERPEEGARLVMFAEPRAASPELEPTAVRGGDLDVPDTLRFEGVHYTYRAREHIDTGSDLPTRRGPEDTLDGDAELAGQRAAVRGLSFELGQLEQVALVGPSGAGKSTVAYLLLRFMEPDAGRITVDGTDLRSLPVEWWRERIAWVPQRPYLFNTTVAQNLWLARPDASLDQLQEASRLAQAHEFIEALPQGYDTVVGERAARLSGGQAQRLALARAFLRDAPFLVLDEPTAHLDPELEAMLQRSTESLMRSRSTLVIAHRLQTASRADRILVMEQGLITESGTHDQLMAREGLYRRLMHASVRNARAS